MKLWMKIKIKSRKWRCYKCKTVTCDNEKVKGVCEHEPGIIRVKESESEKQTLLHEILHALGDDFGFCLRDHEKENGESQIDRVSLALLKFNSDNPTFWERMRK